jgi:sugar lactone lactonase YvrE
MIASLDDQPVAVNVIGSSVYFALFIEGLKSVPTTGGTITPIAGPLDIGGEVGSYMQGPFAFDATNLYWAQSSGGYTTGPVARASLTGASPATLTTSMGFTSGVVADATNVYFVDQDQGSISAVPIAGGSAKSIATGLSTPGGLALRDGILYTLTAGGDLLSVTMSGTVTTLVTGPGLPSNTEVADWTPGLAADDQNIYYSVCAFDGSGAATLSRIPLGGDSPTVLAKSCASGIAVDANSVYWVSASEGTVNAVAIGGGGSKVYADKQGAPVGPAIDADNVYWGTTVVGSASCGLCGPPAPAMGANAIWSIAK